MNAVRQRCRPKHQVLVLKCYPRHQKNNVEVKPNSSELSYLLYYASTRRSKLQKVGDFLDKRTTSDVWKGRIGNVQVTLQIIKALIEKTPRDLPLYGSAVLRIFRTILRSNDVTMIEETVPTFETFCKHQDPANLAADQDFIRQYDEIVHLYASFASKDTPIQAKTAKTVPVLIRFRKAGLEAIKAIASSDVLTSETARQLAVIVPIILENVYSDNGQYLNLLEHREEEKLEQEKELALRRRQSISTVRTAETNEADPVAASGTTEAADKLAEQEAGVIALQALKKVFTIVPRGQLRLVTHEVLEFMAQRIDPKEHFPATTMMTLTAGSWPCTLFALICGWAPVQDRYVIMVTAVETLIRSPIIEENLEKQYVLATIIGWLLSSDINFIGLSVMDVLVGLVQHILLLLQLGGHGTNIRPHHQQADVIDGEHSRQPSPASPVRAPLVTEVSPARLQLLIQLQKCIGCLAVHVYYSDQISDMVAAILARLKPSQHPNINISSTASAIENPTATVEAIVSSTSLSEKHGIDSFFSFDTARVSALESIREIIAWANCTKSDGSSNTTVRSPITVERWEGTQWLLRDPNWPGRVAYVEALLAWMKYELKKQDLRVPDEQHHKKKNAEKKENANKDASLARRAVSNASQRDHSPKRNRNTFLQLLHLAIYENAHQYAESEGDILLLHLLLTHLVQKLGVNAAQHGLPMIMRLQEDIIDIESPIAKINIGSLVHGYLWAVSVHFNFDAASTGRDIQNEISRRLNHSMWLQTLRVPPAPLDQIVQWAKSDPAGPTHYTVKSEALKPYDKLPLLIEKISEGYSVTLYSPPNSPPGSPSRTFSQPMLGTVGRSASISSIPTAKPAPPPQLPQRIKDTLLSDWTREAVIAATTSKSDGSRSASLQGSAGSPTVGATSKHLTVGIPNANGSAIGMNGDGLPSPRRPHSHSHHAHLHNSRPNSAAYGLIPGSAMRDALSFSGRPHSRSARSRRASQSPTAYSTTSSARNAVRVEDLKKVLSGGQIPFTPARGEDEPEEEGDETGSDSMISYEGSDISFAVPANAVAVKIGTPVVGQLREDAAGEVDRPGELDINRDRDAITEGSITPRPTTAASAGVPHRRPSVDSSQSVPQRKLSIGPSSSEYIPPVPPLPANLRSTTTSPQPSTGPTSPSAMNSGFGTRNTSVRSASSRPQSLNGSVSARAAADRPKTAIDASASMKKSHSQRNWRQSQASQHTVASASSGAAGGWGWSARELLNDIDAEAAGSPGSLAGAGRGVGILGGRPPY